MTEAATSSTTEAPGEARPESQPEPQLTALELDCALAYLESPQPSISTLAASLDLHPAELLEILARPHVIHWAEAALAVEHTRDDILARRAHSTSLQTLAEVARDTQRDPVERRRAATAILRATSRHRPRASAADDEQPAPLAALKQLQSAPLAPPAEEHPEPDCTQILGSIPATLARASASDPDSFKPIQQRCARPLRETSLIDFLARTQLHQAAGARLAEHHVFETETGRGMQATVQTDDGDVTLTIICHNFGITAPRWRITSIAINEPEPDPNPHDDPDADLDDDFTPDDAPDPEHVERLIQALQSTLAHPLAHPARPP